MEALKTAGLDGGMLQRASQFKRRGNELNNLYLTPQEASRIPEVLKKLQSLGINAQDVVDMTEGRGVQLLTLSDEALRHAAIMAEKLKSLGLDMGRLLLAKGSVSRKLNIRDEQLESAKATIEILRELDLDPQKLAEEKINLITLPPDSLCNARKVCEWLRGLGMDPMVLTRGGGTHRLMEMLRMSDDELRQVSVGKNHAPPWPALRNPSHPPYPMGHLPSPAASSPALLFPFSAMSLGKAAERLVHLHPQAKRVVSEMEKVGILPEHISRIPRGGALRVLTIDQQTLDHGIKVVTTLRSLGLNPAKLITLQGGGGMSLLHLTDQQLHRAK